MRRRLLLWCPSDRQCDGAGALLVLAGGRAATVPAAAPIDRKASGFERCSIDPLASSCASSRFTCDQSACRAAGEPCRAFGGGDDHATLRAVLVLGGAQASVEVAQAQPPPAAAVARRRRAAHACRHGACAPGHDGTRRVVCEFASGDSTAATVATGQSHVSCVVSVMIVVWCYCGVFVASFITQNPFRFSSLEEQPSK